MRIAYVKGLEDLAKTLSEFGHELVPIDIARECDAVLCDNKLPTIKAPKTGTFYLMATEKSPEQINEQIKSRLYTELFDR